MGVYGDVEGLVFGGMGMKLMVESEGIVSRFVRSKLWQKAAGVDCSGFPWLGVFGLRFGVGGAVFISPSGCLTRHELALEDKLFNMYT